MTNNQNQEENGIEEFVRLQKFLRQNKSVGVGQEQGNKVIAPEKRTLTDEQIALIKNAQSCISEAFSANCARRRPRSYNKLLEMRIYQSTIKNFLVDIPQILTSILDEFLRGIKRPQFSMNLVEYLSCGDLFEENKKEAGKGGVSIDELGVMAQKRELSEDQREIIEICKSNERRKNAVPSDEWERELIKNKISNFDSLNQEQIHALLKCLDVYRIFFEATDCESRSILDSIKFWKKLSSSS